MPHAASPTGRADHPEAAAGAPRGSPRMTRRPAAPRAG